jgi:phenylacetate-coenzyme A ligase PaaK-like adenylate-forming protein
MQKTGNDTTDNSGVEYLALDSLLDMAGQKTAAAVKRSQYLPVYKKKWASLDMKSVNRFDLEQIKQLPFISDADLLADSSNLSSKNGNDTNVQLWTSIDNTNPLIWIPRGMDDMANSPQQAARIAHMLELKNDDILLVLSQPAFRSINMLPYSMALALKAENNGCQVITIDMSLVQNLKKWLDFLKHNRPTVMIAQGDDAVLLAGLLSEENGSHGIADEKLQNQEHRIMPDLKTILLYGKDSILKKAQVENIYLSNTRLSVGLTDLMLGAMECSELSGIHMWLDNGVYEIIPEGNTPGSLADTPVLWLWETEPGMRGELVITSFGEVLPLIRYRSGYHIETLGKEICRCGRTHPRVRLLECSYH